MTDSRRTIPWWLSTGTTQCLFCYQFYVYEYEYRCVHCDAPICQMCIVEIRSEVVCPDCANGEQEW